jgi:uncharacterized protein
MNIVLDTNVLLVAISRNSPYNPIFQALLSNQYQLFITNEILLEYTEIMQEHSNATITRDVSTKTQIIAIFNLSFCTVIAHFL